MLAAAFVSQGAESLSSPMTVAQELQKQRLLAAAQIGGGLLLATGRLPRLAAATLAATVIPANLGGDIFWNETDPLRKSRKRRDFMTDLSLLGGLIIASADTAGKPSLPWRGRHAAKRLSQTAQVGKSSANAGAAVGELAEKVGHQVHAGARRGREIAEAARDRLTG